MTASDKIKSLRAAMRARGLDVYLVTSADAHQSEYVAEHFRARAWLSGFTGSSGQLAVTMGEAGLWTDGRYFLQAEQQLRGSGITLYKMDVEGVPEVHEWIAEKLPLNGALGFDGRTLSWDEWDRLKKDLAPKHIKFIYDTDLAGLIWTDRPPLPAAPVFEHAAPFAGAPRAQKLSAVRSAMQKKNADYYFAAALDDIAWLLNIRGRDIKHTPVAYAYGLIGKTDARIFINPAKLDAPLANALIADGFSLHPYGESEACLRSLPAGSRLLYNEKRVSVQLAEAVPDTVKAQREPDIIAELKAVKNEIEISNIKNAHIKDGAAMARFLKALDEWAHDPARGPLTETGAAQMADGRRAAQDGFLEPSFSTIAAYGGNAASMHYSPEGEGASLLPRGFLLVDSGGQYLDGTTDITRTIALGELTYEMKRDFTLVLKGHIALAQAVFLYGTTGTALDTLARMPLWAHGVNYRSGTGHGIGYCLGVHEGPHNISMRVNPVKLAAGMLVTNEPGVYKDHQYGIRTENLMQVVELYKNEQGTFLGFDIISLCPIDRRAIDISLLSPAEIAFLDRYHQNVYEKISPCLNEDEKAWLAQATQPITQI